MDRNLIVKMTAKIKKNKDNNMKTYMYEYEAHYKYQ